MGHPSSTVVRVGVHVVKRCGEVCAFSSLCRVLCLGIVCCYCFGMTCLGTVLVFVVDHGDMHHLCLLVTLEGSLVLVMVEGRSPGIYTERDGVT